MNERKIKKNQVNIQLNLNQCQKTNYLLVFTKKINISININTDMVQICLNLFMFEDFFKIPFL